MQVEGIKELLHGDLPAFKFVHDAVGVHMVRLLDEAQQVFLVHASGSVDVGVNLEVERREWRVDHRGLGFMGCSNSAWSQDGAEDIHKFRGNEGN